MDDNGGRRGPDDRGVEAHAGSQHYYYYYYYYYYLLDFIWLPL